VARKPRPKVTRAAKSTKTAATKETKAKERAEGIVIPKPDIRTVKVKVKGVMPLICHKFSAKAQKQIEDKQQKKAKSAKPKRDPKQEFMDSMYPLGRGKYGIPATAFKGAMISACRFVDGMKMTLARGAFFVVGDLLEIKGTKPTMRTDVVRLPNGSADMRYRGEFKTWGIALVIRYNANVVSVEQIMNLLATAGFSVGVGERRPEQKSGDSFGTFDVEAA